MCEFLAKMSISVQRAHKVTQGYLYVASKTDQSDPWVASHTEAKELVSWCFEPSQPQRITSGLNTNFTLSPSYSFPESPYHKSRFFFSLFTFRGHSTREPASSKVTFSNLRVYTGNRERFWEKKCMWMDWKGTNKEEIPGSKPSMYGYILTYSRLERRNL